MREGVQGFPSRCVSHFYGIGRWLFDREWHPHFGLFGAVVKLPLSPPVYISPGAVLADWTHVNMPQIESEARQEDTEQTWGWRGRARGEGAYQNMADKLTGGDSS